MSVGGEARICVTCGVQHAPSLVAPASCAICEDERQYVNPGGQTWITLGEMRGTYRNVIEPAAPDLFWIHTDPEFAIGQWALLVRTPAGNVLWDCLSYLDEETVANVSAVGGIAAIAISHPHFYGSYVEWSEAFGGVPIYLHALDRDHAMRPSGHTVHVEEDERELLPGLTLVRLGGHFHGSTVLWWPEGAGSEGALLTGDSLGAVWRQPWLSFLYSYPNDIPLSADEVRDIVRRTEPYAFNALYGPHPDYVIASDAKAVIRRSADRYIGMVEGTWPRR